MNNESISIPCKEVKKYLSEWNNNEKYVAKENVLDKLFSDYFKDNNILENIFIKCTVLNDFYSTNIFDIYTMAKHILSLNIDDRLQKGDLTLVDDIAKVTIGKNKYFYSFASKYCSHHKPKEYPIYDSNVVRALKYFRKKKQGFDFNNDDLKKYKEFKEILIKFQKCYGIEEYNLKDLDRYLWQLGKKMK